MGDFWQNNLAADFGEEVVSARFGAEQSATASSRGTAKPADVHAYAVAQRAGKNLTEAERHYVLAVARGEGYYGLGWKPGQGAGSHNWGAVQGQGPAGSFMHLDHHADGTPYHAPFKAYNNDEEGFADMAHVLLKSNVRAAIRKGSLRDAVFAQHANRYFELDPEKYLSAVMKNYNALVLAHVVPKRLLTEKGGASATTVVLVTALYAGIGYGGYRLLTKKKRTA
jgi:hypothetical protein